MKLRPGYIRTEDQFKEFSKEFQQENKMPFAFGIGINYKDRKENVVATKWITANVKENLGTAAALMERFEVNLTKNSFYYQEFDQKKVENILNCYLGPFLNDGKHHDNIDALQMIYREKAFEFKSRTWSVIFYGDEEFLQKEPIQNIGDAHFRLALMSRLKCKPNTLCLDNLFETLPVLVWQGNKVFTVEDWNRNEWAQPDSLDIVVDKIPLLLFGAPIPAGVRMPNPKSARLGAYLSPGTTIMHYGFVNFNAGTLGKAMVEGTIASGVTIDEGTDIGKGGGFLGTLSGGNKIKISTGKNCLIGAQAECGIPLGDNCVVATGVCFTANTPFMDVTGENVDMQRKAIEFAGKDNLTFRRNSLEGCLEVILQGNKSHLNESLHANSTADTVALVS